MIEITKVQDRIGICNSCANNKGDTIAVSASITGTDKLSMMLCEKCFEELALKLAGWRGKEDAD